MDEFLAQLFPQAPSYFPGLLGQEQANLLQQQARQQGLLGLGMGLLQAAAPSTVRPSLAGGVAQGLMAGQQMAQNVYTQRLQEQQIAQKMAEQQRQKQLEQAFTQALGTEAAFPGATPAQRAAAMFMGPAKGSEFLAKATQEEFSPTPQTLLVNGRPASVLVSKSGATKVLSANPLPNEEKVDTGNEILFRDKTTGAITSRISKTMTPGETALMGIRQQEFIRGAFDIVPTAEGFAYVPVAPGTPAIPVVGPQGQQLQRPDTVKPPTEGQANAAAFLTTMRQATSVLSQPLTDRAGNPILGPDEQPLTAEQAFSQPNLVQAAAAAVPFVGGALESVFSTKDRQRVLQAQQAWVRAKLRKESGAAIGKEEMEQEIKTFFPQIGDAPETIQQKAVMRQQAEQALAIQAGPALQQMPTALPVPGMTPQPQRARPQTQLRYNPQTGRIEAAQ